MLSGEAFLDPKEPALRIEPDSRHPYKKYKYLARGEQQRYLGEDSMMPIPIPMPGGLEETKREIMETTMGGESPMGMRQVPDSFAKSLPQDKSKWSELDQLIHLLQKEAEDRGEFYYLNKPDPDNPYNLVPVSTHSFEQLNEACFFTLSKKGITSYVNS